MFQGCMDNKAEQEYVKGAVQFSDMGWKRVIIRGINCRKAAA